MALVLAGWIPACYDKHHSSRTWTAANDGIDVKQRYAVIFGGDLRNDVWNHCANNACY